MTQQIGEALNNTQIVQNLYQAFNKGDIGAIFAVLSPDVTWMEPDNPYNPAGGTRHGHAGFLEWVQVGKHSEDILALDLQKFIAQGDTVAVTGHMKCRPKATGKIYESDFVHLITLKDGQILKFEEFFDTYAAGEAFRK